MKSCRTERLFEDRRIWEGGSSDPAPGWFAAEEEPGLKSRSPRNASLQHLRPDMFQLVGVAGDVDAHDPAFRDVQRRGLQRVVPLDAYEARKAVDEAVAHQLLHAFGEEAGEAGLQPHDLLDAGDDLQGCRLLAAAIGIAGDIG